MTDQLAHARIRVAEIAQSILDGKVRPLLGARMLAGYVNPLKAEISLDAWKTVVGIASETDGMAIGSERQYWAPEPLREKDKRADDYEQRIAADLLRVAEDLLHQFSK